MDVFINKSFLILHSAPKFGLFKVYLQVNLDLETSTHKLDILLNEGLYCFFILIKDMKIVVLKTSNNIFVFKEKSHK